jgi:rSAM/selenodomain-associated transferase 2
MPSAKRLEKQVDGDRISVIVPTLNEQAQLQATLSQVYLADGDELIVVDGGSTDATVALARQFTPLVLSSPPSRARQMNSGARLAKGDILLFLHADTRLPGDALDAVRTVMQRPDIVGGAFRLAFLPATPALRLIAWGTNMRTRLGRLPYGDQALFMRRQLFEALGGYADVPFLEDVKLVQALRRHGKLALLPQLVHTSGRRWLQDGVVYTTVRNNLLMVCYFCGVSPATLKRWYSARRQRVSRRQICR